MKSAEVNKPLPRAVALPRPLLTGSLLLQLLLTMHDMTNSSIQFKQQQPACSAGPGLSHGGRPACSAVE